MMRHGMAARQRAVPILAPTVDRVLFVRMCPHPARFPCRTWSDHVQKEASGSGGDERAGEDFDQ